MYGVLSSWNSWTLQFYVNSESWIIPFKVTVIVAKRDISAHSWQSFPTRINPFVYKQYTHTYRMFIHSAFSHEFTFILLSAVSSALFQMHEQLFGEREKK